MVYRGFLLERMKRRRRQMIAVKHELGGVWYPNPILKQLVVIERQVMEQSKLYLKQNKI